MPGQEKRRKKNVKSKILELNMQGYNQVEIASIIGVDRSTISKTLKKEGIQPARRRGQRGKSNIRREDFLKNLRTVSEYIAHNPTADVSDIACACDLSTDTVYRCLRHMKHIYYISDVNNPIYIAVRKRMSELRRLGYGHVHSYLSGKYYKLAMSILQMPRIMKIINEAVKKNTIQTMSSVYIMPRKMLHSIPGIVGEEMNAARAEIAATAAIRNERAGWAVVPGPAILELYLMVMVQNKCTKEEIMAVAEETLNTAGVVNTEATIEEVVVPHNEFTIYSLTDQQIKEYSNIPSKAASWSAYESFVYGKKALGRKAKYATISYLLGFAKDHKIPYLQLPELSKVYAAENRWIAQAVAWGFGSHC